MLGNSELFHWEMRKLEYLSTNSCQLRVDMGGIRPPNESLWARKRILRRELQLFATKSPQCVVGKSVLHK